MPFDRICRVLWSSGSVSCPACGEVKDIGQGLVQLFQWALDVHRNPILLPDAIDDSHDPLVSA